MGLISWVSSNDGFECGFELGEGFDAVDFSNFDQRGDMAPSFATFVVT